MDFSDCGEMLDASGSRKMIIHKDSETVPSGSEPNDDKNQDGDGVDAPQDIDPATGSIEDGKSEGEATLTLESLHPQFDQFLSSFTLPNSTAQQENEAKAESSDHEVSKQVAEGKVVAVDIPAFIEKFLDLFAEEVKSRESEEGRGKWGHSLENDTLFLASLERVCQLASSFEPLRSDPILGVLVNHVDSIQQRAMSHLEEEFKLLLEEPLSDHELRNQPTKQNADDAGEPDDEELFRYSEDAIKNMSVIAKAMISGGYETECCQVYSLVRRHAFGLMLSDSGFDKISMEEIQKMAWDALEREIPQWNSACRKLATALFFMEKKLAFSVFEGDPLIASSMFTNLARGVAIQLLNFAEAVAMTKRSAEKLFKLLDMYETLRDSLNAFGELFAEEECGEELKKEMFNTRCRIGEAAICMFCDLENSIQGDTGRTPVPGGAVHPLTRYTMNYLKYTCDFKEVLQQVFREHPRIERADPSNRPNINGEEGESTEREAAGRGNQNDGSSPFALQLISIMDLLDANLEAKSKLYRDVSLSSIFMMNNGRYILQKIRGSKEIHEAVGDTWCRRKSFDIRNYHNSYKQETWRKLLMLLAHEGLQVNNKVIKPVLKERLKGFTSMFEEIHRTQVSWVIHDEQLRSELRVSISAVVIPAYRSFLGRFSQHLTPGRQYEKYIKYQPEDIETAIDELFDGKAAPSIARKKP